MQRITTSFLRTIGGGRQLRSAGDLGLQQVLTLQLSTLTWTTLGQVGLDAKLCYDCIIRPIAVIACYKFGMPINLCCWLMAVLETSQHHILTTNRRFIKSYTSSLEHHLHGASQGSSSAPTIWLLISSILFFPMRQWAQGVRWSSPKKDLIIRRYTDAFVDNTTLWANNITDPYKMAQRLQQDLTRYQEMLTWTGGALTLEKCYFSILEWKFTSDGSPYLYDKVHHVAIPRNVPDCQRIEKVVQDIRDNGLDTQRQHTIEQLTGQIYLIKATPAFQNHFLSNCAEQVNIPEQQSTDTQTYLGLKMTPAGPTLEAETLFHTKNQRFGIQMVSSQLQPQEVFLAYREVQTPSQQYRFHGAQFTKEFLTKETNFLTSTLLCLSIVGEPDVTYRVP